MKTIKRGSRVDTLDYLGTVLKISGGIYTVILDYHIGDTGERTIRDFRRDQFIWIL